MKLFQRGRRWWIVLGVTLAVGGALVAFANLRVLRRHQSHLYADVASVPAREVGLVLGTSPTTGGGLPNLHFAYRIEAAAALYKAGKVRHLLVSGDNHRRDYDEPSRMKEALVARGVPPGAITCDYAGFRTLDSVVRARSVFGLTSCTVVTQRYHNSRALEIAAANGIDAIGFCTRDVPVRHALRTEVREIFARTLTVLDLYVWHRRPHFEGPYEPIVLARR